MIEMIAFDADDTLWHNETMFQATETKFTELLREYHEEKWIRERLFATEMKNLRMYGYGAKGFILSMIETAIDLTEGRLAGPEIQTILGWGHELLQAPTELLEGVRETIAALATSHRLMLITKGDLFDQESKLARSGVGEFFSAVEIVSSKTAETYCRLMARHDVSPQNFVMVGNSLRSDILPALETGAHAVHIPYAMTWAHEAVSEEELAGRSFARLERIADLPTWLEELESRGSE